MAQIQGEKAIQERIDKTHVKNNHPQEKKMSKDQSSERQKTKERKKEPHKGKRKKEKKKAPLCSSLLACSIASSDS